MTLKLTITKLTGRMAMKMFHQGHSIHRDQNNHWVLVVNEAPIRKYEDFKMALQECLRDKFKDDASMDDDGPSKPRSKGNPRSKKQPKDS